MLRMGWVLWPVAVAGVALWLTGGTLWAQEADGEGMPAREPGAAEAASEVEGSAEWEATKLGVLADMERLKAEIHLLSVLNLLQTRLFEWNEALRESGGGLQSLDASLCGEAELKVWCEIVPVSFGRLEEGG